MGKLEVWLKEKGMEVEKMAEKDTNHKDKFENDNDFKEMLTEMNNVVREGLKNKIKKKYGIFHTFLTPPSGGVKYGIYL